MNNTSSSGSPQGYANDASSETLQIALQHMDNSATLKKAVDLGCGSGEDTLKLLQNGWEVTAIDCNEKDIKQLSNGIKEEYKNRLITKVSQFETMDLPPVHLINASLALPHCDPKKFSNVWRTICNALNVNGYFCGHFFGPLDFRAKCKDMTFHSKDGVMVLFEDFDIVFFDEKQEVGVSLAGVPRCWHIFHIVAKKK